MLGAWIGLFVRSGLILAAAEVLRRCWRKSDAGYRHRILLAGFGLLLIWPLFSAVLPEIHVPLWIQTSSRGVVTVRQTFAALQQGLPQRPAVNWPLLIWVAGFVLAFVPVIADHLKVHMLVRHANRLEDECWRDLLAGERVRLGLKASPQLLIHSSPVVPFTFGLRRPRILLPADCMEWTPLRRRTVLVHELAHIKRRDLLWQFFANVTAALWWFQPLCWSSRWHLRRESERACDALVLESGIRPSEYASELLEIARLFSTGQRWSRAAIAVTRRGELEGRLYAILDPEPNRVRRDPFLAIAALTVLTLTASAVTVLPESNLSGGNSMKRTLISGLLTSAGLSAATIAGSVFDPGGAAIANAQASLYNPETSATQETTTAPDGKFTFGSLPAGSYILHVEKPGFASLYREFNVQQDSDLKRELVLNVASPERMEDEKARAAEGQQSNLEPVRVPGSFAQAKLIRKVPPVYPAAAKSAHIQGAVRLAAVLSKEGVPLDISVISSPSDDLTKSALEAVRQWRYTPTLLNGGPVEILTDVTVTYTLTE